MNELALFAGAGGGILGGRLLGWRTVCAVEIDAYARSVLLARQRDGMLERFPVWDDVSTFDGQPWRGKVDVISGGFPCTDISQAGYAGGKREGIDGESSGLWAEMARVVSEVRPQYVFVENARELVGRGLAVVLGDLAAMGYDARWCCLGNGHISGRHQRTRLWLVAYPSVRNGEHLPRVKENPREEAGHSWEWTILKSARQDWWDSEPGLGRVVDGVAGGVVKRLKAIGNGQSPQVAATAFKILNEN